MRFRLPAIAATALVAVALAGCTTTARGNPVAGSAPSDESTSSGVPGDEPPAPDDELPSDGAPKVENPIDASHFEQNPCEALTAAQARQLNVNPEGERSDSSFGNGCAWRNPETHGDTSIGFLSEEKRGLSSTYRSYKQGHTAYFKPIPDIEGHPAVAMNPDDEKPDTTCAVVVGLTDQLAFMNITNLSSRNIGAKDPCEVAVMAATYMMKTIVSGS